MKPLLQVCSQAARSISIDIDIDIGIVKHFTLLDYERIWGALFLSVADAASEIKAPIRAALVLENVMEGK